MYSLPKKWKSRIFEGRFWASIAVGLLLITATVVLGWRIYNSPPTEGVPFLPSPNGQSRARRGLLRSSLASHSRKFAHRRRAGVLPNPGPGESWPDPTRRHSSSAYDKPRRNSANPPTPEPTNAKLAATKMSGHTS
jgi:hypothetical protein